MRLFIVYTGLFFSTALLGYSWDGDVSKVSSTLASRYSLPMPDFRYLVEAVIEVESGGNPNAASNRGALGLMQLTPIAVVEAARFCNLKSIGTGEAAMAALLHPPTNIWHGACYLVSLLREGLPRAGYRVGNQVLAPELLLWYNGGLRQVERWHRGQRVALESRRYMLSVMQRVQAKQLIKRWELSNGQRSKGPSSVPQRPRTSTGRQSRARIGDHSIQGHYLRFP